MLFNLDARIDAHLIHVTCVLCMRRAWTEFCPIISNKRYLRYRNEHESIELVGNCKICVPSRLASFFHFLNFATNPIWYYVLYIIRSSSSCHCNSLLILKHAAIVCMCILSGLGEYISYPAIYCSFNYCIRHPNNSCKRNITSIKKFR